MLYSLLNKFAIISKDGSTMYYCCGITEKGVMPHNEDALLIGRHVMTAGMIEKRLEPPFIMAVSDGVSGENAGELASVMCLESVRKIENLRLTLILFSRG